MRNVEELLALRIRLRLRLSWRVVWGGWFWVRLARQGHTWHPGIPSRRARGQRTALAGNRDLLLWIPDKLPHLIGVTTVINTEGWFLHFACNPDNVPANDCTAERLRLRRES